MHSLDTELEPFAELEILYRWLAVWLLVKLCQAGAVVFMMSWFTTFVDKRSLKVRGPG